MTTTVRIEAHCSDDIRVRVTIEDGNQGKHVYLSDGDTHSEVVYDDRVITVREEARPKDAA